MITKNKIKIYSFIFSGVLSSFNLVGCNRSNQELVINNYEKEPYVISIPIEEDIRFNNIQYEYYEGYNPVGISIKTYGNLNDKYRVGNIIYSKQPDLKKEIINNDSNIKIFNIGEHIISIPLKDNYEYHEGYEIVGVANTAYAKKGDNYSNGVVLYINTELVECIKEKDGYINFGIPIENEKVKNLEY